MNGVLWHISLVISMLYLLWVRWMNTTSKQHWLALFHPPIDQATTVSRRVNKFAELMQSVWLIKNDHERRVHLVQKFNFFNSCSILIIFSSAFSRPLLHPIPMVSSIFHRYLHRRQGPISQIHYLQTNHETNLGCRKTRRSYPFGNVQTKLRTYGLHEYSTPPGLALSDLDAAWKMLLEKEAERSRKIDAQIWQ